MENANPKGGAADASFRAPETTDVRSALILAKVALQVLADLHPEAASSIDHALAREIKAARSDAHLTSAQLAALLQEVRAGLRAEDELPLDTAASWFMD